MFALRDIDAGADVAGELPIWGIAGHTVIEYPAILSVGSSETILHAERLTSMKGGEIDLQAAIKILSMDALGPDVH